MIIKHSEGRIDGVYADKDDAVKETKKKASIEESKEEKDKKSVEKEKKLNADN